MLINCLRDTFKTFLRVKKELISFIFLILVILCSKQLKSQDPLFSQLFATPVFLNPAFAGSDGYYRLTFNYRNLPFPGFGAFSAFNVSYDQPVRALGGGVGLLVTSDFQSNLIIRNQLSAIYSLHVQLTRNVYMNLALQAGYLRKELNWKNLVFANQYHPFFNETLPISEHPPERTWRQTASFSTGMLVFSNRFYGGIALHHLNRPKESIFSDDFRLPIKATLHLGLHIPFELLRAPYGENQHFFLSPNIIFFNQGVNRYASYGLYVGIWEVTGGLWFRHGSELQETLVFMLGLSRDDFRVAYSYDHAVSGFSGVFQGAHEISVTLDLFKGTKKAHQRIINSPRF